MKDVKEFAKELSDAYSTSRYGGNWQPTIRMLRKRGYSDAAVEAIIRSKWTRYAADQAGAVENVPAAALARFLDNPENRIDSSSVQVLINDSGHPGAHVFADHVKTYELITGVFQVRVLKDEYGAEVLCVPQRVKLRNGISRGAALPKILATVARRYRTSDRYVKFWFWCDRWAVPGQDVVVQLDNSGRPAINAFVE